MSAQQVAGSPMMSPTLQLLQDRSQVGCYFHLNQRLHDVMVLSDINYQVKVPITNKGNEVEDDRLQITLKRLAGSDDEEPIGRYEDSMSTFKQQGYNRVGKRWIQLAAPLKSASASKASPSGKLGGSPPYKDSLVTSPIIAPKALVFFYYGDKTLGSQALEAELSKGSASFLGDDSILGTPFGVAADLSCGSTPMQDSPTKSGSHHRAQSNEKKDGPGQQPYQDMGNSSNRNRRMTQALPQGSQFLKLRGDGGDKTPQNFEDAKQSSTNISKLARSDPEVQEKLEELDHATKTYLAFDMNRFQQNMNKELEQHINRLNQEFKQHSASVNQRLDQCEASNEESILLKDQMVKCRTVKQHQLIELSLQGDHYQAQFTKVNDNKHNLRQHLSQLDLQLRRIQRDLASINLENSSLKSLIQGESELAHARQAENQATAVTLIQDMQMQAALIQEDQVRVAKQKEQAQHGCQQLEKIQGDSQTKVQVLLKSIESTREKLSEALRNVDADLKKMQNDNRQLKIHKEKSEASHRQLEKEYDQVQRLERQQREEWVKKIGELENSIKEKRVIVEDLISQLSIVSQDINALKKEAQTIQYKVEYQQSLREMHDNNQYEVRLKKLQADIEASTRKAAALEAELSRVCDEWEIYYEEAVMQMKQRLEELGSGATFEAIEKVLFQISEKDKVIASLTQAVQEMRAEVASKQTSSVEDTQAIHEAQQDGQRKLGIYRQLLAEKAILYDQLHASAKQLMNRDDIILKNEQDIIKLKYEIDLSKLEIYQKRELIQDLEEELNSEKNRCKSLKGDIKRLEKKATDLTNLLKQKEDELDQLDEMMRDKDSQIEELERMIGDRQEVQSLQNAVKNSQKGQKEKKPVGWYRPIKGDLIDELIAKYFNAMRMPLPIKRLGDGFYMFGTRKIFVKVIQGRLVVRVGGGFMSIEEFMEQYQDSELSKVQQMIENGTFNLDEFMSGDQGYAIVEGGTISPMRRKSVGRSQSPPKRD